MSDLTQEEYRQKRKLDAISSAVAVVGLVFLLAMAVQIVINF